jgi:hypothetical protein
MHGKAGKARTGSEFVVETTDEPAIAYLRRLEISSIIAS